MNANFGLLDPLSEEIRSKRERRQKLAGRALETVRAWVAANAGAPASGGR